MLSIGVIAGGRGTRLAGMAACKPLLKIRGKPLISHILDSSLEFGVERIAVATRADDTTLANFLRSRYGSTSSIELIPSEAEGTGHAARLVQVALGLTDHIFATADVLCTPEDLATLVDVFVSRPGHVDGVFAITRTIGQDAPVFVECRGNEIVGYGKQIAPQPRSWGDVRVVSSRYASWTAANSHSPRDTVMTAEFLSSHPRSLRAVVIDHLRDVDTPADVHAVENSCTSEEAAGHGV